MINELRAITTMKLNHEMHRNADYKDLIPSMQSFEAQIRPDALYTILLSRVK